MTLQKAKDIVAKKMGFKNWNHYLSCSTMEQKKEEAIELYIQSERARIWDEGYKAHRKAAVSIIKPSNPYKS